MKLNNLPDFLKLLFYLVRIIYNVRIEFALRANLALASSVDPLDCTNSIAAGNIITV